MAYIDCSWLASISLAANVYQLFDVFNVDFSIHFSCAIANGLAVSQNHPILLLWPWVICVSLTIYKSNAIIIKLSSILDVTSSCHFAAETGYILKGKKSKKWKHRNSLVRFWLRAALMLAYQNWLRSFEGVMKQTQRIARIFYPLSITYRYALQKNRFLRTCRAGYTIS